MAPRTFYSKENRLTDPFKPQETPTPTDTPLEDLLAGIKNESGEQKYKDLPTALKALQESQENFIPTLLREKKELEGRLNESAEELTKRKTLEELTEALKARNAPPESTSQETPKEVVSSAIKETDIEKLLESKLAQREQASQETQNYNSVVEVLVSKFGDKAASHIQATATKLDTTSAQLEALAKTNPKLALSLLDPTGGAVTPKSSTSTQFAPRTPDTDNPLPTFDKGATRGGMTNDEMVARWREVGKHTYKRLGVEIN